MRLDSGFWYGWKQFAAHATGWPMDSLHVLAGVPLQLLGCWLLRCSVSDRRPWLIVLVLEVANEAYDLWIERWPSLLVQLGEGARDLLGTMILPTLLLLIARRRPQLLAGHR